MLSIFKKDDKILLGNVILAIVSYILWSQTLWIKAKQDEITSPQMHDVFAVNLCVLFQV